MEVGMKEVLITYSSMLVCKGWIYLCQCVTRAISGRVMGGGEEIILTTCAVEGYSSVHVC